MVYGDCLVCNCNYVNIVSALSDSSIRWVFKEMFKKDLVYYGHKVMPFSTALATPLSNFEANQEMRDVKDPAGLDNSTMSNSSCCSDCVFPC